jgi:PAS domain S-box-containing protein
MKIYEYQPGMYVYAHLPAFASYVLQQKLDEFIKDLLTFSREMNIPLLRYLSHYSEEQIVALSKTTSSEYLSYLANNQAKEQLINSFTKWYNDQLQVIGKFEIDIEDVTVLNYIRGKALKRRIPGYEVTSEIKFKLFEEIDNLLFGATTSSTRTFIDILRERIREESHFNEQLINTSPGIIFIFDLEKQKEVYVNGNVQEIMGFSAEEIIAMGDSILPSLTHPKDLDKVRNCIEQIVTDQSGHTHSLEYRFKDKSGKYQWLRTYLTIFKRNTEGKPIQLLGTTFEISSEKEIALALHQREQQLLEAQAIANLGSFEWDILNDKSVNTPELLKIFEFGGQQPHDHFMAKVHEADKDKVQSAITQSFITGNYDCQYRYIAPSGEKILWARGMVIFDSKKPVVMRGTVQDITQLKRIEAELMRKTLELQRSNESLQQFASIASHDLKEPLRKMSMYTDMVITSESAVLSAQSKVGLEKVKSSAIRMQKMIEDILNYSSLVEKEQRQITDLNKVISDATEILEDNILEKNAKIIFDSLPKAFVVPSQLRQLFQNLIANSIKFAQPGIDPVITISGKILRGHQMDGSVAPNDKYLQIRLSDNGIGFKQEHAQRIFGLFTRLHARGTYEGTGLGLSICKRIAENHGGKIEAMSKQGEGAEFIITIPQEH